MKMRFALMALLSVLAVAAQAQDTVLYGKFHASIDFVDNGGKGNGTSSVNVSSNSSRFGIRGSEVIMPGLKGIFQVENDISFSSQNSSSLASRDTFVGLEGGFGQIKIGRNDTPFKKASRATDLFGDQAGDSRNILASTPNVGGGWDARLSDSIIYTTPSIAGFEASLLYVPDEADAALSSDIFSVSGMYKTKAFDIVVAYEQKGEVLVNNKTKRADGLRIGGNVRFGAIRIAALYQTVSLDQNDDAAYGIGASYKFGQNLVKAQFYSADNEGKNKNADMFALGFERSLSKRTKAYAIYAQTSNDANVKYSSFAGGHGGLGVAPVNDKTFSGFSLGVEHSF
jgi:predicted porin